jgi:hypothetical protein
MLGKSAKLPWGLGRKTLKIMYEGVLVTFYKVWRPAFGNMLYVRRET